MAISDALGIRATPSQRAMALEARSWTRALKLGRRAANSRNQSAGKTGAAMRGLVRASRALHHCLRRAKILSA